MSYKPLSSRIIYTGPKFQLESLELSDATGATFQRDIVRHNGAVVIIAFPDPQTVLLIKNFRIAAGKELIELPAGTLEPGEEPQLCASRELEEETGYAADRIEKLTTFYASPGFLSEKMHIFAAYDLRKTQTALEPGEQITLLPTPFSTALDLVGSGKIEDGKTIATLLWFDRFRKAIL